jgi:hypothetical protein
LIPHHLLIIHSIFEKNPAKNTVGSVADLPGQLFNVPFKVFCMKEKIIPWTSWQCMKLECYSICFLIIAVVEVNTPTCLC